MRNETRVKGREGERNGRIGQGGKGEETRNEKRERGWEGKVRGLESGKLVNFAATKQLNNSRLVISRASAVLDSSPKIESS